MAAARTPVAAYSFDENQGEAAHDSSGSHTGTITGAEWTEDGRYGSALTFNGTSDEVKAPSAPSLQLTESFTLEAWVYPTAEHAWDFVAGKQDTAEGAPFGYALYGTNGTSAPTLALADSEGKEVFQSAEVSLPDDTWSQLAVTSDGTNLTFFVDGEEDATRPAVHVKSTSGPLVIGGSELLEQYFKGKLDEMRFYDEALTQQEIAEDAQIAIPPSSGAVENNPEIVAKGPLAEVEEGALIRPDAPIDLSIHDINSRIAQVNVLLDGKVEQTVTAVEARNEGARQECIGEECDFEYELTPNFSEASPGSHTITLTATDRRGYTNQVAYGAVFDAEGPELSFAGPLAESSQVQEEEAKTLEISADDGEGSNSSGVAEIRVIVEGSVVASESFPCSPCSEPSTFSFEYSAASWGLAPHDLTVEAWDKAGNETTRSLRVNSDPQALLPQCGTPEPESTSSTPVSSSEAIERVEEVVPNAVAPNVNTVEALDPTLQATTLSSGGPEVFDGQGTAEGGYIETQTGGGMTIGPVACLMPMTTTAAEIREPITGAPVVVAANSAKGVDTFMRTTAMGGALIESIRGPGAPSSYSWEIRTGFADELVELESGAVAILNSSGADRPSRERVESPTEASDPAALNNVELQLKSALYDTGLANNQLEGEVTAVIPMPMAVNAEGETESVALSIGPTGRVITATPANGTKALVLRTEAAVNPLAMCATAIGGSEASFAAGCETEAINERQWLEGAGWLSESKLLYGSAMPHDEGWASLTSNTATGGEEEFAPEQFTDLEEPWPSPSGEQIVAVGCKINWEDCGIVLADADGSNAELITQPGRVFNSYLPSFSASGNRILFWSERSEGIYANSQLYSIKLDGSGEKQITNFTDPNAWQCEVYEIPQCPIGARPGSEAVASPDGQYLVLENLENIYRMPSGAEKISQEEATLLNGEPSLYPDISPDSSHISYSTPNGIWQMSINGTEKEHLLTAGTSFSESWVRHPTYSPSGSELAYDLWGQLYTMPISGGASTQIAPAEEQLTPAEAAAVTDPEIAGEQEGAEALLHELAGFSSPVDNAYELPEDINEAERDFCEANLTQFEECIRFFADKDRAEDMRHKVFTVGGAVATGAVFDRSTRGNAFQHAFWTALMSQDSTNTHEIKGYKFLDGFVFALIHEGPGPFEWDSQMDIINDWAGYNYFWKTVGKSEQDVCEGLRSKTSSDIFLGHRVSPFKWLKSHPAFHMRRMVYRFLKTDTGTGLIVKLNGRTCVGTW